MGPHKRLKNASQRVFAVENLETLRGGHFTAAAQDPSTLGYIL